MKYKILIILSLVVSLIFLIISVMNNLEKREAKVFYNTFLPVSNKVDLTQVEEKYSNVVGYIKIENSDINYPIVQADDNEYYLSHLPNGEKNKSGSIYLDYRNNGFNDDNIIIYGHNMKDGTMFSDLVNYQNQEYYEKHKSFKIYTENGEFNIDIFAVYFVDASKESIPVNFVNNEKEDYINEILKENIIDSDVTIDSEKLVSLCTCAGDKETSRLIIVGKIIN